MPRRDKNQPRIGGYSRFRGERLEDQPVYAFNVDENIYNLARQICRCHAFWPDGYPMPMALACFDRISCRINRELAKSLATALMSRTCNRLDSYIRRMKGHEAGLANVNIRGRCDNVFYSEGVCTCIISGYPKSCLESIIPSDALPLVLKPDGQPADFYPDSIKEAFPRYYRDAYGLVYPYPANYHEQKVRDFATQESGSSK